jgi:hypothetical protein
VSVGYSADGEVDDVSGGGGGGGDSGTIPSEDRNVSPARVRGVGVGGVGGSPEGKKKMKKKTSSHLTKGGPVAAAPLWEVGSTKFAVARAVDSAHEVSYADTGASEAPSWMGDGATSHILKLQAELNAARAENDRVRSLPARSLH